MITPSTSSLVVMGALALASASAHADPFSDGLKEYTGEYSRAWVLGKLTTFKVGKNCAARLADKTEGALHAASFYTRDILEYAKALTGEDWSALESQNNSDRETNKALVEPKLDAFKSRFGVTVSVEGDDCDAKQSSLWLRYWTTLGTSLKNFPPKAAKVFVTLNVTSKARDVTVESKDGSTFTITAPKDIEAADWSNKIDKPFRKLAAGLPDDFAFESKESSGRYSSAWVLSKLTTFKVGKKCLAKLPSKDQGAIHMASFYTRDILQYAMAAGADDWDKIEQQSANDPKTNRDLVDKMMNEFKSRFGVTVTVEGDDCDARSGALWLKYWGQIATSLKNYPPRANKVFITLNVISKAKDVSVTAGKDGATFAIVAPRDKEPPAWTDKYDVAFKQVARKPK